jgi:hypothetical protein
LKGPNLAHSPGWNAYDPVRRGFVREIAHNPGFGLAEDGSVILKP